MYHYYLAMIRYRASLRSSRFPLHSSLFGRTVLDDGMDDHNIRIPSNIGGDSSNNAGNPQVIFLENVMPFSEGYESVSFCKEGSCAFKTSVIYEIGNVGQITQNGIIKKDGTCCPFSFELHKDFSVVKLHDLVYVFDPSDNTFYRLSNTTTPIVFNENWEHEKDIHGNVEPLDSDYLTPLFCGNHCKLQPIEPLCIPSVAVKGITKCNNRLVAYTKNVFYVSNMEIGKELDFKKSLSNGAGFEQSLNVMSDINFCVELNDGFAIYTDTETSLAKFNANSDHLSLTFRPLFNIGAKKRLDVASDSSYHILSGSHINRIQSDRKVSVLFPHISEFYSRREIEEYKGRQYTYTSHDKSGNDLSGCPIEDKHYSAETQLQFDGECGYVPTFEETQLQTKCVDYIHRTCTIAGNFIVFSYGESESYYDYALVWNIPLSRFGKIKFKHTAVYSDNKDTIESLLFISDNGLSYRMNGYNCKKSCSNDSVILFGRYEASRTNLIEIQDIDIELKHNEGFETFLINSLDNVTMVKDTKLTANIENNRMIKYLTRLTGRNFWVKMHGSFFLYSLTFGFSVRGKR